MNDKIGLIQLDGKMPNLALMKLATWHRQKGDDVRIIDLSSLGINKWHGSKIFMGGSGYDVKQNLPSEIDAQIPDYDLFNIDYSLGFTSRGCIRDCGFCIVKEKEGNYSEKEFKKDIKHVNYIIMDNNFLASKIWKEKLQFFIHNNIKVNFNQGLDIRLIDDEKAEMLSKVKYYNRTFTRRCIYFAFDNPIMENLFKEKINILKKYIKSYQIMIYILVGFNTDFDQDMKRFEIVNELGCDPYIMIFNNRKDDKKLRDFARWVNKRIYRKCKFEEYNVSNY